MTRLTRRRLVRALGKTAQTLERIAGRHGRLYLAGGAVRDVLLGRPVHDVDCAVAGRSPVNAGRRFADAAGGALVVLGGRKLARVVLGGTTVDFTPLRAPSIEGDLRRRDFTVNAMAVPIPFSDNPRLIDPLGGAVDLRRRRLRLCSPRSLAEDPVRLWRAARLRHEFGLRWDPASLRRARRDAGRARSCSPERLRDELVKLLSGKNAAKALREADGLGVLTSGFPGLAATRRVRVPGGGVIKVLEHTLEAMAHLDRLVKRPGQAVPGAAEEAARHLAGEPVTGRPRAALLRLALLFHDVAKPDTASLGEGGHPHFFEHEHLGARAAGKIARERLKCAEAEADIVERIIRMHLRPGYLAAVPRLTDRAAYRFLRDAGEELFDILLHAQADRMATHHGRVVSAAAQRRAISRILAVREAMRSRRAASRPVTGHDLMREFRVKPGPVVGAMLRAVDEAVALGRVKTRKQALTEAKRVLDRTAKRMLS